MRTERRSFWFSASARLPRPGGRPDRSALAGQEGRKAGRQARKKEGRKAGRKEGRKEAESRGKTGKTISGNGR